MPSGISMCKFQEINKIQYPSFICKISKQSEYNRSEKKLMNERLLIKEKQTLTCYVDSFAPTENRKEWYNYIADKGKKKVHAPDTMPGNLTPQHEGIIKTTFTVYVSLMSY